jgi:Zn-dependent protease with chaperone function
MLWASLSQFTCFRHISLRFVLILSFHLRPGLQSGIFPSLFPTKMMYTLLISPMHATYLVHRIFLYLFTLISDKEYKLWSSSLHNFLYAVTSWLLLLNINNTPTLMTRRGSSASAETQLRTERTEINSRQEKWWLLLLANASRPALAPTQPPIQWVPGALTPEVKRPGREADHLVPRLRMLGAIPPLFQYVFMTRYLVKHRSGLGLPATTSKLGAEAYAIGTVSFRCS